MINLQRRSLSPAQIKYFKISPKLDSLDNNSTKKLVDQALQEKTVLLSNSNTTVSMQIRKLSKSTFGNFQKTVNNFGVLLNKNLGNETAFHQVQKFGERARRINSLMKLAADNTNINSARKAELNQKIKDRSDGRTFLKAVYQLKNLKLYLTLKSFELEIIRPNRGNQGLPIPYLRFLTQHVNSNRLVMVVESSLKIEGNQIVVEYERIENRASIYKNNEQKYEEPEFFFERLGQQLKLKVPVLQVTVVDLNFRKSYIIDNIDILKTINANFGNVEELVQKYVSSEELFRNEKLGQ